MRVFVDMDSVANGAVKAYADVGGHVPIDDMRVEFYPDDDMFWIYDVDGALYDETGATTSDPTR
jgi:hypothetical protein